MTTGAFTGGTGPETYVAAVVAAGGATASGTSGLVVSYTVTSTSAGATASGTPQATAEYLIAVAEVGVWANGSALATALFNPSLSSAGTAGAGQVVVRTTFTPEITSAGVIAVAIDVQGGFSNIFFVESAGVLAAGRSGVSISYTNPSRRTLHRFEIGDVIYVPVGNRYLKQCVHGMRCVSGYDSWQTKLGWFSDYQVLSPDEYREWLGHRAQGGRP